jgi:hypothetical protein
MAIFAHLLEKDKLAVICGNYTYDDDTLDFAKKNPLVRWLLSLAFRVVLSDLLLLKKACKRSEHLIPCPVFDAFFLLSMNQNTDKRRI